eukprot:PITA_32969
MEKVQIMLSNFDLEKNFLAEAVKTTCYLINKSPTIALNGVSLKKFGLEIQPDNAPPQLVRRSSRPHNPSQRYPPSNYILFTDEDEPNCFQEACKVEHDEEWKKAMEEEMNSLMENKTWELVNLPKGRKALQNKWVYSIKHEGDEKKERYKAKLVVKGFAQKEGIDFIEIF